MKVVIHFLGWLLWLSVLFRIPPFIVALMNQEPIVGLTLSMFVSALLGYLCLRFTKRARIHHMSITKGLALATLSFVVLSLIGAIPYTFYFEGPAFDVFTDSFFESVSGFTTTGYTVIENLNDVPLNLQFWRAETQWIGGIGIMLVFLFIFSKLRRESYARKSGSAESVSALYQAGGFSEKLEPSISKSTKDILIIYLTYTILGILILFFIGTPLFDAFTITFTSLSTGGFDVTPGFSTGQMIVVGLLMLIGSISFITHNNAFNKRFRLFLKDSQIKWLLGFVLIFALLSIVLKLNFGHIVFELINAFSTTGYGTADVNMWPSLFLFFIVIGMMVGGSVGSTSGGLKIFRVQTLLNSVGWFLKKLSRPSSAVTPFKMNGEVIEEEQVIIIHTFVFCFVLFLIVGTIIFMLLGHDLMGSTFQVISGLTNTGLASISIAGLHAIGKYTLIFLMILGRLEIFPVLLAIDMMLKRKR